jgi:hypothetical protein
MHVIQRLLREPLLHFLILGAVLFGIYGWVNRDGFAAPDEIVVSRGQVASLQAQFARVWQRQPTGEELAGLIDNWVREEIFYREGLAMGLDRDDPVVRRRIQQKVAFVLDSATPEPPSADELQQWLNEHPDAYRIDGRYALHQVYFDPVRRGEKLQADVDAALRGLNAGRPMEGDATMLPAQLNGDATEVIRAFGGDFETALRDLPLGSWQGPVRSGFGLHLVQLTEREPPRTPGLDEVRAEVERDFMHRRTQDASEAFYQRLLANYRVRVEGDASPSADGAG